MNEQAAAPLIEARHLKKYFKVSKGQLHAVDDVSLAIGSGRTLGVVGESGCGKSTLGRTILRLVPPTSGEILFKGASVMAQSRAEARKTQQKMQMIFQDPYSSLNPRMSVQELIAEPMIVNKFYRDEVELYDEVSKLMDMVGLAQRLSGAYPHELDGGRRQRIGVARALALKPEFIVCDEPVSSLDVSIQAQILNLLMDLQERLGLAYMFITHDLSVVKHISDEIMVMYLGQCVERAPVRELFANPRHPYTQALLSAIPIPVYREEKRERIVIRGEVSNPVNPKPGCRFAVRCPYATEACAAQDPPMYPVGEGHTAACVLCAGQGH